MTEAIEKNSSRNTTRNLKLSVIYLCYEIIIRTNIKKYTMHRKKETGFQRWAEKFQYVVLQAFYFGMQQNMQNGITAKKHTTIQKEFRVRHMGHTQKWKTQDISRFSIYRKLLSHCYLFFFVIIPITQQQQHKRVLYEKLLCIFYL